MRWSPRRLGVKGPVLLIACLLSSTTACSKSGPESPPATGVQPGAPGQPAAGAAGAPAAAPGQAAASSTAGPAAAPAALPPPRTFTLAEGAVLTVETTSTLSTASVTAGEKFEGTLVEPIVAGDWVVAKAGAAVEGTVVESTKGGRVKGTAQLAVAITALTLTDGQRVRIESAMKATAAESEKKKDVGKVAVATGAGAIIGAIAGGGKGAAIGAAVGGVGGTAVVLGTRGGPAEIPARSHLRFTVTRPVVITEKK